MESNLLVKHKPTKSFLVLWKSIFCKVTINVFEKKYVEKNGIRMRNNSDWCKHGEKSCKSCLYWKICGYKKEHKFFGWWKGVSQTQINQKLFSLSKNLFF